MSKLSAEKFLEFVERSGLVEKDQLSQAVASLRESDTAVMDDGERLAERLIEAKILTRWQCDNLLQGKYKAFLLGRYKLKSLLGSGGMSSVYLAEHTGMRCLRAIKVLPQSRVEDSSYLARFRQEAVAAAKLNHPNIVQAFDIDQEGKHHFIVMEYVEGHDLQSLVKDQGPLDYDVAANYIRQAAEGLGYAHESGLIHRDIKPANLLVDPRGTVKLLDLGLARFVDEKTPSLTIAHDENVLGTADYLAPEQAVDSHGVDYRADIYSLGCTLYFVLTGHPPFPNGTLPQRIYMHQHKAPRSIYEDRPDAPQALVELCGRMMAKTPEARFQSAKEVANALGAWVTARQGDSGSIPAGTRPPPRRGAGVPASRPPRRSGTPGVGRPDDTIADMDRETIKGQSASRSPSNPAAQARPGDSNAGRPPGTKSDPNLRKAEPLKSGELRRAQALPKANELADDPASALFAAGIGSDPKLARDLIGQRMTTGKKKAQSKPMPKWFWFAIAGAVALSAIVAALAIFLPHK